jgi:hypothetical protein
LWRFLQQVFDRSLNLSYPVCNSHNLQRDILRRKYKIDASGFDSTLRHVWLACGVEPLREGNSAHFFYAAQCLCAVAIISQRQSQRSVCLPSSSSGNTEKP